MQIHTHSRVLCNANNDGSNSTALYAARVVGSRLMFVGAKMKKKLLFNALQRALGIIKKFSFY
jgi:hypothetical protein